MMRFYHVSGDICGVSDDIYQRVILARYQVLIPNRYRVILLRYQISCDSYHVEGDTCEVSDDTYQISGAEHQSVVAGGPTVHIPRRSSSPAATSSTVRATSELIAGGLVLRHPRPTPELPTAASSTIHATSELVAGGRVLRHPRPTMELVTSGCFLRHLDELAKYVLIVLRVDDGGKGSTFALYLLIYHHVRAGFLLPGAGAAAGAAGKERVVMGQCVDGAGVGAPAPPPMSAMRASWSGTMSYRGCCCCSGRAWLGITPL
uniref:Uncharacterized protein n=1 Tax=Oryza meridionalis TaxID=40149 RepID=A0A0E0ER88_9ORYZ